VAEVKSVEGAAALDGAALAEGAPELTAAPPGPATDVVSEPDSM